MSADFHRRGVQYDAQHAHLTADIEFYRQIVREFGDPVLELACGTGRVSIPLARDGHKVTGIDIEESMLATARSTNDTDAAFHQADMRGFELDGRYAVALLPFNSVGHLHCRDDVEGCFQSVWRHLSPDGVFVVAMFNPDLKLLARRPEEEREISRYPDPESDNEVVVRERVVYDKAAQIVTSTWHYVIGDSEFETELRLRIFYPQELEALLHYSGFKVFRRCGDFDGRAFGSDSPHQIYLATPRRQP